MTVSPHLMDTLIRARSVANGEYSLCSLDSVGGRYSEDASVQ